MPEMDLGTIESLDLTGPCELSGALGDAGYRLATYLTWPDNERRRRQYLATLGASALADIENEPLEGETVEFAKAHPIEWEKIRRASIEKIMNTHFRPHGGFASLVEGPGWAALCAEMDKHASAWIATGRILYLIRCIAEYHPEVRGGASVKKAVALVSRFVEEEDAIKDRSRLVAAWSRFKPVAHLCAALLEAASAASKEDGPLRQEILGGAFYFQGLGRTLAVARDYQQFVTSFVPHAQREPFVRADRILGVPAKARIRPMSASIRPLSPEMLETLADYRAPLPI